MTRSLGFCARRGILAICIDCVTVKCRDYRVGDLRLPLSLRHDDSGVPRPDINAYFRHVQRVFAFCASHPAMAASPLFTDKRRDGSLVYVPAKW